MHYWTRQTICFGIASLLLFGPAAFAQVGSNTKVTQTPPAQPSSTKNPDTSLIKRLLNQRGTLLQRDYGKIATIAGKYDDSVVIETIVVTQPGLGEDHKTYGVRFERYDKDGEEQGVGFLDLDEAKTLVASLDLMQKKAAAMKSESHENTEFEYTSRDDVTIGFFQAVTDQTAYVKIDFKTIFIEMDKLQEINTALQLAVTRLQAPAKP